MSQAGPKTKRKRAVNVCTRCKSLKLRCDLALPCSACNKAKVGAKCTYKPWPDDEDDSHRGEYTGSGISAGDLAARVVRLEAHVAGMTPSSSPPRSTPGPTSWQDIVLSLPPPQEVQDLLESFYRVDTMFRTTHVPSFKRGVEDILPRLPHLDFTSAPFVARMLSAMLIGSYGREVEKGLPEKLEYLFERVISLIDRTLSTQIDLLNLDYVIALLLSSHRYVHGEDASPHAAWISLGKTIQAARLLGLDSDPDEIEIETNASTLDKELRRRAWFLIVLSETILASQLPLRSLLQGATYTTRPPALICDNALDDPSQPNDGIPEWSYILTKSRLVQDPIVVDSSKPWSIEVVDALLKRLESTKASLPPHLHFPRPAQANEPPWVFAQACVMSLNMDNDVLRTLRPAVSSMVDPETQSFALRCQIRLACRVIEATQAYMNMVLFRWTGGKTMNTWTFGIKVFNAGLALVYGLLTNAFPEHRADDITQLDSAIGALGVLTSDKSVQCHLNDKAMAILQRLRARIDGDDSGAEGQIIDPYTGQTLHMSSPTPPPYHTPQSLPGSTAMEVNVADLLDWDNWENIFGIPI